MVDEPASQHYTLSSSGILSVSLPAMSTGTVSHTLQIDVTVDGVTTRYRPEFTYSRIQQNRIIPSRRTNFRANGQESILALDTQISNNSTFPLIQGQGSGVGNNGWSIEFLFYQNNTSDYASLFGWGDPGEGKFASGLSSEIVFSSSDIRISRKVSSVSNTSSSVTGAGIGWYHLAITYTGHVGTSVGAGNRADAVLEKILANTGKSLQMIAGKPQQQAAPVSPIQPNFAPNETTA